MGSKQRRISLITRINCSKKLFTEHYMVDKCQKSVSTKEVSFQIIILTPVTVSKLWGLRWTG